MIRTIEGRQARPDRHSAASPTATNSPAVLNDIVGARTDKDRAGITAWVRNGTLDPRSFIYALIGGILFFALGLVSMEFSRVGAGLASIWLPAAAVTVMALRAQLSNELPFVGCVAVAALAVNLYAGNSALISAGYVLGNIVEIAAITWLIRQRCGACADMSDVQHLGQFLLFGGIIGPVLSTSIIALTTAISGNPAGATAMAWFFAHSIGMILIAPALLLTIDAVQDRKMVSLVEFAERSALMAGGLIIVYGVFAQTHYPLLFLVPPITLLMAFRVGGLGTALYVPLIAILAGVMTLWGSGPIVMTTGPDAEQVYVLLAFVAANFLTGLPIAAILAGRARMMQELIEGRSELALLTENVTDAVLRIDDHGVCTYASPSVRDVMGRDPEELLGKAVAGAAHIDSQERIAAVLKRLRDGESDQERVTYRRLYDAADGTPIFIEADAAIATDPVTGKRSGIVVSARDVTERVELELLLTRARRTAEDAAAAKSEFLANMSHEIRTPMNGVLGFAELMLQSDLDEEHRRHTEMIVQSGRSMMLLLNDILDLSKIEAGQITIDKSPVDLVSTVNECVMLHLPVAEKKGLDLIFYAACSEPKGCTVKCNGCESQSTGPWVVTDALRLRQIILNLVGNAVKFTENGRVTVSLAMKDGEFTVAIQDTGIGIDSARQDTIFAPFTQGENDTARRFGGTGLGLTISRQLADLLGGSISVESEGGEGSTFTLTMPAMLAHPEQPPSLFTEASGPIEIPQAARILLVEDHDVNRMLGVEMLERCGQSVDVAHDGNEAIAMVMDGVMRDRFYDLVLMDIQMPGCDGYDATRAIRKEGIGPDSMPIIALTANAFPEDIHAARAAGMQGHLAKPLDFTDLARALQRWLPTRIVETEDDLVTQEKEQVPAAKIVEENRDQSNEALSKVSGGSFAQLPQQHSPDLIERWNTRRSEAIEAVRTALQSGAMGEDSRRAKDWDDLARLVHKLAGSAAIFGEADLGDQAAALERALRQSLPGDVREALAFELLSVADDPADTLAKTGT